MNDNKTLKLPKLDAKLPETIEECHDLIRDIHAITTSLFKIAERVEKLELENRELKERLNNNSSNSSLPPSKDYKKKTKKAPSNKKSGGQIGHKGHFRQLLKSSEVDLIINCKLPEQCSCGGKIKLKNKYHRHQIHELPVVKLHVTEYCLEKGICISCQSNHVASLPNGATWGITGPRLTGFMSHLISKYQLSRRELQEFLKEQLQFNISLGTVFNKQKIVNIALEEPVLELLDTVKQSQCLHSDETSHNRDGKKQWLWSFVSSKFAFFSVQPSRGKKVLKTFLGDFRNIITSDRYIIYNYFDSSNRQICWAHLKRDFTRVSEKKDKIISRIGKNLLYSEAELFKIWHEYKRGAIKRDELIRLSNPIQKRVGEFLEQGTYTDPSFKIVRFCKNLLKDFNALWTFIHYEGVEPTNNHAERCLRSSVTWRKKYFCTRSDYGSEYVARTASINTTCKLQVKSSFNFICETLENYFSQTKAPSLCL